MIGRSSGQSNDMDSEENGRIKSETRRNRIKEPVGEETGQ